MLRFIGFQSVPSNHCHFQDDFNILDLLSDETPARISDFKRFRYMKEPSGSNNWKLPAKFRESGNGDCEDYAMYALKAWSLENISNSCLWMVVGVTGGVASVPKWHAISVKNTISDPKMCDTRLVTGFVDDFDHDIYNFTPYQAMNLNGDILWFIPDRSQR